MADARTQGAAGFSLLEVIAVLVLFGLLAALAMEDSDTTAYDTAAEAEVFKASLRFAQELAYAQAELPAGVDEVRWGLNITGNSFTLARDGGVSANINLPGTNSPTHVLPNGVSITNSQDIAFNFRGIPMTPAGVALGTITFLVSGGDMTKTITVTQQTGFLQ